MTVVVKNLTKVYGEQKAVNDISFSVGRGEIVGFLGPNGAGKSTTMKIATGYLPPTFGSVTVDGWDVVEQPLVVKRTVGYLPEHNPLYLDMYVLEYLLFTASVFGLSGKEGRVRSEEMINLCGLTAERSKKIESLSKGYRQRVGLAAALIHNPSVLILDEPTSGLDPNQILEIRRVIKEISREKTVIFSTHIMQEVEALCSRVLLINRGVLVADDELHRLREKTERSEMVVVEFEKPVAEDLLAGIEGVAVVSSLGQNRYRLKAKENLDIRPAVFRFAADHQLSLVGLKQEVSSLENIFQELTQKA